MKFENISQWSFILPNGNKLNEWDRTHYNQHIELIYVHSRIDKMLFSLQNLPFFFKYQLIAYLWWLTMKPFLLHWSNLDFTLSFIINAITGQGSFFWLFQI